MGLTDYNNREVRYGDNGSKTVTTHENGNGYADGYHTRCVYDSNGNLVRGSVYNGQLYGGKTHDNHTHYEYGHGDAHGTLRSSIFGD